MNVYAVQLDIVWENKHANHVKVRALLESAAPTICYDVRFPEHFRSAVRLGANLYFVIACWPVMREHHWVTLLQAGAIDNQAYVVGVNRCGNDPKFAYPGRSMIIDPHGQV